MSRTMTLKTLVAALLLTFGWQSASAQAFWTETFSDETTSTANWVNGGTNSGPIDWDWTNVLDAGAWQPGNFGSPSGNTGYMWFDSDANGDVAHDVTLTGVGNPADCSGKSDVHLRFYTLFRIFSTVYNGQVGISLDGTNFNYYSVPEFQGLDGQSAATDRYEGWVDLAIPEANGQSQVWVQFRWQGQFEYYWKVDDLEMYEFSTPTQDVTFQVNMALETVDPTGVFFNIDGGAAEAMTDDGNGVWSITKNLEQGSSHEYRFWNGATPEAGDAACGVDDGAGGYNRTLTVSGDEVLPAVCFGLCTPCDVPCDLNPNAIICDNFDAYNPALKLGPQATWWTTWSGTEGTNEDGIVSAEQALSAPYSFKLISTAAAGGPQDVVLNLGNKTTGNYELKWMMYIPSGKQGYYNIQNVVPIGPGSWNLDVFFSANGSGNIQVGAGASLATFTYPYDTWFEVKHSIDLDNNLLSLYIAGDYVKKMAYPNNLGGIDFYGTNGSTLYYVDDVSYVALPAVVYNVDLCAAAVDLTTYFGQPAGVAQTTGLYDNTTATVSMTDPLPSCFSDFPTGAKLNTTMWYTFTGDGGRYHVETVPCNATNYIGSAQDDLGDTQMAIYEGNNCSDLTEVVCNDDLFTSGDPDWRAGVDIETTNGQEYFILIDGYEFQGVVATGEYCIEITQEASVPCAEGAVGTFTVDNSGFICFGDNLNTYMMPDPASFTIPTVGPVFGMVWCITAQPVPANAWPGTIPNIASTVFNPEVILVSLPNDGSGFAPGQYYLTPVVVGGGTLIDPAGLARVFNVDPSAGCFFVGQSTPIVLLPQLANLDAQASQVTPETVPPGNNGAITLEVEGGIAEFLGDPSLYEYLWSNGSTSASPTGLAAGTYTVTISDPTNCVDDFVLSVTVGLVSGTTDPASVEMLTVSPNPTTNQTMLNLTLETAQEVRIELVNTLGQTLQTLNAGTVKTLNQSLNLASFANGTYFLRVMVGNETAVRRIVVQR